MTPLKSAGGTLTSFEKVKQFQAASKQKQSTFNAAITAKALSKGMVKKAADSSLTFMHLRLSFCRNGRDGLASLLGDRTEGSIRVTQSTRIIDSLASYLETNE